MWGVSRHVHSIQLFSFSFSLFLTKSSNALYLQRKLLQYNCMFKRIVHVCKHVDAETTFMFCTLHGSMFSCTDRPWACSTPARAFSLFGRDRFNGLMKIHVDQKMKGNYQEKGEISSRCSGVEKFLFWISRCVWLRKHENAFSFGENHMTDDV